jgi:hypothetical protein
MKRTLSFLLIVFFASGCDELAGLVSTTPASGPPTSSEIAAGLKEALIIGAQNSVMQTSAENGFYGNPLIKIPFPPEAAKVAEKARDFGFDKQVDQFVETMNHGAEQAAAKATPIFVDAIKGMTFQDVYGIWHGEDDAATQYLRENTMSQLKTEFRPVIKDALNQVEVTKYWNPLINTYNQIPFVTKLNPDLDEYVLEETLNGLFTTLAKEEAQIREDPAARVTDLLRRVFGYQQD